MREPLITKIPITEEMCSEAIEEEKKYYLTIEQLQTGVINERSRPFRKNKDHFRLGVLGQDVFDLFLRMNEVVYQSHRYRSDDPYWQEHKFDGVGDIDFVINDRTVDVKTNDFIGEEIWLLVNEAEFKHRPLEFYVLVYAGFNMSFGYILGYATKNEVASSEVKNFYQQREGNCYVLKEIRSFEAFFHPDLLNFYPRRFGRDTLADMQKIKDVRLGDFL